MIPQNLHAFFWDIRVAEFDPHAYPDYTIGRILEFGNAEAISWLQQTFTPAEIGRVLRSERRLSARSANYWALVYRIPFEEIAALHV